MTSGATSDALPSERIPFAGGVGPIDEVEYMPGPGGWRGGVGRTPSIVSYYRSSVPQSVFLRISDWAKAQICSAGDIRIGRVHADDDVWPWVVRFVSA